MRKGMKEAMRSRGRGTVDPKMEKDTIGGRDKVMQGKAKKDVRVGGPKTKQPRFKADPAKPPVKSSGAKKVSDPVGFNKGKPKSKPKTKADMPASKGKGVTPAKGKRYKAEPVKPRMSKYAKGGSVRGAGCATKGVRKAKTY